jgi:FixJ family two-component response regulator
MFPDAGKVMDQLVAGKTNNLIAPRLGSTVHRTEDPRPKMSNKLGLKLSAELVGLPTAGNSPRGVALPDARVNGQ